MNSTLGKILLQLRSYHVKYWRNQLILALLKSLIWLFCFSLVLVLLEYLAWFPVQIRELLYFLFFLLLIFTFAFFTYKPIYELCRSLHSADFLKLAKEIGRFLPADQSDELINYLQLSEQNRLQKNELLLAAISQKEAQFTPFTFGEFVNKEILKYPAYTFFALTLGIALGQFVFPSLLRKPALRIWNYSSHYSKELPFQFVVLNQPLQAIAGEPTEIRLKLVGKNLPSDAAILFKEEQLSMKAGALPNEFTLLLPVLQKATQIQFKAGSFYSDPIFLPLVFRPGVQQVLMRIKYPAYLKKDPEVLSQAEEVQVPEGTSITWELTGFHSDKLGIFFSSNKETLWANHFPLSQKFQISKQLFQSSDYQILALNQDLPLQKSLAKSIEVIPDKKPVVNLSTIEDSLYFRFKVLQLQVADDYGISRVNMHFDLRRKGASKSLTFVRSIPYPRGMANFSTDFIWRIDSLQMGAGDQLQYFIEAFDNDGLHGSKVGRSEKIIWEYPSAQKLLSITTEKVDKIEEQVKISLDKAREMKQDLAEINQRILLNKELNEQSIKELSAKELAFKKAVDDLKKLNDEWMGQQMSFQKSDPSWQQKMENLQKLIQQLWDPSMDKEKENLLNKFDKENPSLWKNHLDQMRKQGKSVENELKRLEKFYQELKVQKIVQETVDDLKKLAKEQTDLAQKNEGAKELEKQEELLQKFEEDRKNISEAEQEQNQLKDEKPLDEEKEIQEEIQELMEDAKENLSKNSPKKAQEKQKKAGEKLQQLAEKLENQMEAQEAMELNVDLGKIRLLMEDLLQVSFEQERLLKWFRSANLEDVSIRKRIQEQVKLGETVHLMEDSLQSLAKKLMPVSQMITKEGELLRQKMDETAKLLKERKWSMVLYRQQEAMASSNKLAVLLSNLLKQIENQQMQSKPGKKKGKGQSSKGEWGKRQQKVNEKMRQLKQSNSGGSSEELMKLAEEQFRIRQEIEQKMQDINGLPGLNDLQKTLQDLAKQLDKNETDIVNKRLNNAMNKQQEQLLPRLMEAENALKEQGEDAKRSSKSAIQQWRENPPPNLLPYLKKQAINRELYQKVPVDLLPKYQEKVLKFLKE